MKKQIKIVFLIVLLFVTSAYYGAKKNRQYSFQAKYDRSKLILKENGSFIQTKRGCTYFFKAYGTWKEIGDTIYLKQEKINWKHGFGEYAERANKLFKINSYSLQYVWDRKLGNTNVHVLTLKK